MCIKWPCCNSQLLEQITAKYRFTMNWGWVLKNRNRTSPSLSNVTLHYLWVIITFTLKSKLRTRIALWEISGKNRHIGRICIILQKKTEKYAIILNWNGWLDSLCLFNWQIMIMSMTNWLWQELESFVLNYDTSSFPSIICNQLISAHMSLDFFSPVDIFRRSCQSMWSNYTRNITYVNIFVKLTSKIGFEILVYVQSCNATCMLGPAWINRLSVELAQM